MIKKVQEKIKNLFFVTLLFSAAISFAQPTATSATDVASDGFTANWESFTGSTGYYLDISESPTFGEGQYASNLIISEYGEGSGGSKKYVEIFNGTGAAVDLANYKIWVISNGGNWPESQITLSGTLANGDAYVIANNSTDVYNADMYTGSLSHNGDDAIGLAWNGGSGTNFNVIDAVGTDGADPGTGWSVAGVANATKDKILIRKSSVFDPTMDWAASAGTNAGNSQWIVSSFTYDTVTQTTDLGSHTFDGGFVPSFVTGFDGLDVGNVTSHMVTGLEAETTYYYRVRSYDGVDVTDNSNTIQVITTASACGTIDLPTAEAQMLCSGDATVANLTVTTGDMPQWYEAETGGTALTPETVVTTGTYYVSQTVGVCESERLAVEVSVIGAPVANAQLFCGSATVADLMASSSIPSPSQQETFSGLPGGTLSADYNLSLGTWSFNNVVVSAGEYLVLFDSNPAGAHVVSPSFDGMQSVTFDALSLSGESTISVIKVINGVETLVTTVDLLQGVNIGDTGAYTTFTVDINDPSSNLQIKLEASSVPAEASYIEVVKNISFTEFSDAGYVFNWYDVATGGTALTDDTALTTATYYVSQVADSCESERTMVEVTINDIPAAPTAETVQEFCGSATLANVVVTGDNITWYDAPTGGLEVATDMVLTGGTHLYYAAQTVNGCESADRIAIAITVNVIPVPEVENLTLCGDSTVADLTVVSGTDVKWYNAAVGGNLLASDAAIATGTYYATQTVDGCESERTAVIVTINPLPVSPTADAQAFCGSATVADLTAEGTNILETIFNDNFNNLNNWSAISLQGSNGWAISSNGNPSNAPYVMLNGYQQNNLDWLVSNPIAVPANALSTTLSFITASNYNGPTLQVYYTTNYTGDVATTDWQTLSPTLSSGSWAWVNSGNLDISDAAGSDLVIAYKYTSSTGSNNAKAWEIDNVKVNIEYQDLHWYDMIGNELAETDALSSGTYHVTQTIGGCESESTEVDVTVNPIPAAPIADAQMFCGAATIADIMVTVDGTATWYADATTTTPLASDTALTTTAYYVSQTINGCEGERTMVEVTVNEIPAAPVADAQTFCGLTTVADLTATGENLMWYDVETGGVALLDGLVAATGTYYVSQTVNGCESERTMVDVTVNEIPVAPLADAQMFCGTATVAELTVNMGENVMWYDVETEGTALATDAALATGTYYVSQTVNGCESPRAMVAVTVNEIPAAPVADAQMFCGTATTIDLAVTGENVMWYDVETGGTALAVDAVLATGTYYVSQTVNGCESERTAVDVTVNPIPAVPTADAQLFCGSATAAELTATAEGAAIWYADATTTTALSVDAELMTGLYYVSQIVNGCESPRIAVSVTVNEIPAAPVADAQTFCGSAVASELMAVTEGAAIWYADEITMTPLAADAELATADYYVSQIVNGCESARTMVEVTINEIPVAPTADNFTFCGSATVADLSVTTGEMPMWYTTETGGDALNMNAPLATGMYYVSQTVNGCESARTMVDVTVNEIPAVPMAEGLQTFCTEATIASIVITGENITWYDALEGGSIVAADMALTEGTSIYYASQTVNGCESARTAVAVVLNITSAPTAEDLAYCGLTTVADLTATGENLMWYDVETDGTALAADAAVATGTYYVSQTVNGCESARVAVNVTVTEVVMPTGEATQEFTAGETIADLEVDGTNVIWFSDAELTVMVETTTELTDGTTYYAVANNGDCASEALAVTAEEVLKTAVIADAKFTHYPNPIEDVLNIEYKEDITSVTVYNVIGQLVLERNTNGNNVQVNMSTLSAGTYIVRVASDNKSTSFKVVKN